MVLIPGKDPVLTSFFYPLEYETTREEGSKSRVDFRCMETIDRYQKRI